MTAAQPWGGPTKAQPPPNPQRFVLIAVLLAVLALIGYFTGRYVERRALDTPRTRMELALEALKDGYDKTAFVLFEPLAEAGNARAQYELATLYQWGWGTTADPAKAVDLYRKAAEQGLLPAELRLGEIYLHGTLVLQDLSKAREWFEKAAKAGDSTAEQQLSDIYERGLGTPADPIQAYAWNAVAATRGNSLAASQRDRILQKLTPEQQAEAEARAKTLEDTLKPPPASPAAASPQTK